MIREYLPTTKLSTVNIYTISGKSKENLNLLREVINIR